MRDPELVSFALNTPYTNFLWEVVWVSPTGQNQSEAAFKVLANRSVLPRIWQLRWPSPSALTSHRPLRVQLTARIRLLVGALCFLGYGGSWWTNMLLYKTPCPLGVHDVFSMVMACPTTVDLSLYMCRNWLPVLSYIDLIHQTFSIMIKMYLKKKFSSR